MKPKCKAWISLVCALAMLLSLLPTTVLAADGETGGTTDTSSSAVTINKEATPLDGELNTTVTLSVGATEEHKDAYVVFVLDKSTSADVRTAACSMLSELMGQVTAGYTVNVSVIGFEKSVKTMLGWTELNADSYSTISTALNEKLSESGTNIYLGLTTAKQMLDNVQADAAYKHLVLVTDGITYLWGDNGSPLSIYSESISNGEESLNAGNDMMGKHHPDNLAAFINEFSDMRTWMATHGAAVASDIATYQHAYSEGQIKPDKTGLLQDSTYEAAGFVEANHDYIPGESLTEHYSANEAAVYMAATVWQEIVNAGYNAYAYADTTDSNAANAVTYPWASNFVSGLGTIGGMSALVSDSTVTGMFDNVKSSILYEIASGTIEDSITDAFSLVGMDTFKLTVGGEEVAANVSGSTINFGTSAEDGTYPYTLAFDAEANSFTFYINVPVETAKPLALSYQLKLTNPGTAGTITDKQTVATNENAELMYTPTEGGEKTETFPVPEVSYYLAGVQPADITIYMGGDEGYEGVANNDGAIVSNNSLPEPGYYITLPDEVNTALRNAGLIDANNTPVDLSKYISIRSTDGSSWTLQQYGATYSAARNKYIYAITPTSGTISHAFRLTFTDAAGNTYDRDTFSPAQQGALHQSYTMEIYQKPFEDKDVLIDVTVGGKTYTCFATAQTGNLNIRYVTGDQDSVVTPAYDSVEQASQADDPNQTALTHAYVIADPNNQFFINGSSVDVTNSVADVSLLFDDVVTSSNTAGMTDYTAQLRDQAIATAAQSFENVQYQAKYLDLVDAKNGNVWLTTKNPVTVYWPYPEGTDANTTFYLVHFEDMDREMSNTEIADAINSATKELIPVTTDAYGISFQTNSFSPYVLLWDAKTTQPETTPSQPSNPGTTVTPTATPAPTTAPVGTPATGDATPVALFGGAAVLAAVVLAALIVVRKRYNR